MNSINHSIFYRMLVVFIFSLVLIQTNEGLMGIQGVYFQRWLLKIPSVDTTWRDWEGKYPSSKIMK